MTNIPVLKRAIFSSRAEDIPYEAWDSIGRITVDSIEGLHMKVERMEYLEVSSDDPYVTLRY